MPSSNSHTARHTFKRGFTRKLYKTLDQRAVLIAVSEPVSPAFTSLPVGSYSHLGNLQVHRGIEHDERQWPQALIKRAVGIASPSICRSGSLRPRDSRRRLSRDAARN